MSKLVSPYRNIKQYTRISIEPFNMNSDIKNNMKIILKKKIEKKCNKNGFVDEVYRILEYSDGIMPPENLNGSVIYNITYHCKICIPVENTIIIGQIKVINQELIIAVNGPIMFFIPKENVDTNNWDIPDGYLNKQKKKKLQKDDFVKIQVVDKRINQNDSQIKSIGKLIDFATTDEVDKYFGSKIVYERIIDGVKISQSNDELSQLESINTEEQQDTESNYII
jgi:DNA-directed RNA polymerase subunit E'/Rpb7